MQRTAFALVLAAVLCAAALPPARAADTPVDLELILAVDVSRSMDVDEQKLQRDGYVAALTHPQIIAAITRGFHGRIALTYVEWAGPGTQSMVMDWRVIDGPESAAAFAGGLGRAPIQRLRGTSISDSLVSLAPRFDGNGYAGTRRVIDVSGDGPNNMGMPIEMAREPVLRAGITINGLPIMIKTGGFFSIDDLDVYYEDCVIGGDGAFLVVVRSPDQFAEAIRRKLMLEIAGHAPRAIPAAMVAQGKRIDCLIGEKLREQWLRE
jgi:hypothetical protein